MEFQNYIKILNLKNYIEPTIKTYRLYFSSTELAKKTAEIYMHITLKTIIGIKSPLDDLK